MENYSYNELVKYARDNKIKKYNQYTTRETLLEYIKNYKKPLTLNEIKEYCKAHNIKGYSNKKKKELLEYIKTYDYKHFIDEYDSFVAYVNDYDNEVIEYMYSNNSNIIYKFNCSGYNILKINTAFKNRLATYRIENKDYSHTIYSFMISIFQDIIDLIYQYLIEHNSLKVNMKMICNFINRINKNERELNFKTKNERIYMGTNLNEYLNNQIIKIIDESNIFINVKGGSNLVFNYVKYIEIRINKYNPLRAASYVPLPDKIANKKAIINIKNTDQKCFLYCIIKHLYPDVTKDNRVPKKHLNILDHLNLEYPIKLRDIKKVEKELKLNINVFSLNQYDEIIPFLPSNNEYESEINLMYYKNHFSLIRNYNRLINRQYSYDTYAHKYCTRCLLQIKDDEQEHKRYCMKNKPAKIILPEPNDKYIYFKNIKFTQEIPFVIIADFETILLNISKCNKNKNESYTTKYQQHEPCGYCYYVLYSHGEYEEPKIYRGKNVGTHFISNIIKDVNEIIEIYDQEEEEEDIEPELSGECCKCKYKDNLSLHYDSLTGKFIGTVCKICKFKLKLPKFVPVLLHNLSNYDAHIIIKELGFDNGTIKVIPNSSEKFISFSKYINGTEIRFIDSCKFLNASLDTLCNNLDDNDFIYTKKYFKDDYKLFIQKGIYPYDYMDSFDKFNQTQFPTKDEFGNKLNGYYDEDDNLIVEEITDEEYNRALNVYNKMKCNNLGDYHDLYLKSDVLILTDIINTFRKRCLLYYELDPLWYYTLPGLSWDVMLKMTNIKLELLTDYDMIMMIENGKRGGISQCSKRYAKANNKYLSDYNQNEASSYLLDLDANNLYGWAMSESLPYSNFNWEYDITLDQILNTNDDNDIGYIIEADIEYPISLHDYHKDYPLAPENKIPPTSNSKTKKLLTTLDNKYKYILHYRNLKLYVLLGLKVIKIHRVISFKQSKWLKPYIDFNTNKRQNSNNTFDKNFFKLMNNSVFGKTMENIRDRLDLKIITNERKYEKTVALPTYNHSIYLNENMVIVRLDRVEFKYNKPVYIGVSILDISKIRMYEFHYNVMKKKYNDNIELLYTDTDSLKYLIYTKDVYEDIKEIINEFDTSDYDINNKYNIPLINKKIPGKMKDENNGKIFTEFIGLRSKMYYQTTDEDKNKKVCKGIKNNIIDKTINRDHYYNCLTKNEIYRRKMNNIASYEHNIYSVELNKVALDNNDNKRYILDDKINTLPWGHKDILLNRTN